MQSRRDSQDRYTDDVLEAINAGAGVHRAGVQRNAAIHDGPFRGAETRGAGQKKTTNGGFHPPAGKTGFSYLSF